MKKYAFSFALPCVVAAPASLVLDMFQKYIFSDWEFLRFLIVFMALDTLVSWWYHILKKTFSSRGFSQLFVKIITYSILLILAHGFAAYTVGGETFEPLKWFRAFICTALLVREGISIVENLNKIKPGIIPTTISKYMKDFNEKGEFKP